MRKENKVLQTMPVPILMYSVEPWALNKKERKKTRYRNGISISG